MKKWNRNHQTKLARKNEISLLQVIWKKSKRASEQEGEDRVKAAFEQLFECIQKTFGGTKDIKKEWEDYKQRELENLKYKKLRKAKRVTVWFQEKRRA